MEPIVIDQELFSSIAGFKLTDAAVFMYCWGLINTRHLTVESKRLRFPEAAPSEEITEFTWVDYRHLMRSMPLLQLRSKKSVYLRLGRLVKFGLLEKITYQHRMPYVKASAKATALMKIIRKSNKEP